MSRVYHEGQRSLQDRFDKRKLADRIEERLVRDVIDESDKSFIEKMSMFFLATSDEQGKPQCSYKGGAPGFVLVVDERTIAFPSYDGNWKRRPWARDVLAKGDPARKDEPKD